MSRPSTETRISSPLPFAEAPGGVRVRVRVTPRARAARIDGLQGEADGGVRLRVAVTEAADAGRANAALLALLAKAWRLPRGTLSITAGVADRRKTVSIAGDSGSLLRWSQTEGWRAGD